MIKIEGEKCSIVEYHVQLITIPIANYPVSQEYIRVPLIETYDDEGDEDHTIYPYKLRTFGQETSFPTRLFLLNEKAIKKRDEHTYWETLSSWNKFLRSKSFSKKSQRLQLAISCYTRKSLISWDLLKQQAFMNLVRQAITIGSDQHAQHIQTLESNIRQLIAVSMTQTTVFTLNHAINDQLLSTIQNLQRKIDELNNETKTYLQKHRTLRYIDPKTGAALQGNPYLFEVHEILANLQAYHHASTRGAGEIIYEILNSRLNGGPNVIPRNDTPSKFTSGIALILKGLCAFDKTASRLSRSRDLFIAHDGSTNGEYFWSFGVGGYDPQSEETWKAALRVKRTHSHTGSAMARDSEEIIREIQQSQKEQGSKVNPIWEYNLVVMDTTSCNSGEVLGFVGMWQRILELACAIARVSPVKVIFIPCADHGKSLLYCFLSAHSSEKPNNLVTNTGEEKVGPDLNLVPLTTDTLSQVDEKIQLYLVKKKRQSPRLKIWNGIFEGECLLVNRHCCTVYSMLRKYHRDIVQQFGSGVYEQRLKDLDSDFRLIIFLDRITENRFLSITKRKHILCRNRERILRFFGTKTNELTDNERNAVLSLQNPVMIFCLMIGSVSYCASKAYLYEMRQNLTVERLKLLVQKRLNHLESYGKHTNFLSEVNLSAERNPYYYQRGRLKRFFGGMINIFTQESCSVLKAKMSKVMSITDERVLRRHLLSTQRYIERSLYHTFRYMREHHNPRSSDVILSAFLVLQTENMDRFSMLEDFSNSRLKVLLSRSHQLYRNKVPEYQRLVKACHYKRLVIKLADLEKNDKETVKVVREELTEKKILLKKGERIELRHLQFYFEHHARAQGREQLKISNRIERYVSMMNGIARIVSSRNPFVRYRFSGKYYFQAMADQLAHVENRRTRNKSKRSILVKRKIDVEDDWDDGRRRKRRKVNEGKK